MTLCVIKSLIVDASSTDVPDNADEDDTDEDADVEDFDPFEG